MPMDFVRWLQRLLRTREYPVTMVCGEQPTYLLSRYKEEFSSYTSIPLVDFDTFIMCRDKSLTMKEATRCGVPIPKTWYPEEEGIESVARSVSYPVILKPCISNGARGISYPNCAEELIANYYKTKEEYGACIVQEKIPHTGTQYKAELLLNKDLEVRIWGVYSKIRYYPPTGGSSTLNKTVYYLEILKLAEKILRHIGWWGMGDCDFIVDPRDNIPKLMEINPRFTRTIRVLVEAGLDYPYELYRLALGEDPKERKSYRQGVYLRYLAGDLGWFMRSSDRFRTRPSFFKFFGKDLHYEEFSFHDPGPALGFWFSMLKDMLDIQERRRRLR
jgi:predicted ATP-grasp superfamily ATP-dependent carboligase